MRKLLLKNLYSKSPYEILSAEGDLDFHTEKMSTIEFSKYSNRFAYVIQYRR